MSFSDYSKIKTNEDLMETISHGSDDYPFRFYDETMSMFDFNTIDWHWHSEFEFVYVESGSITVTVGSETFTAAKGNGLFINSKELHLFHSAEDAAIPNLLFSPSFIAPIDSLIYRKYIKPLMDSGPSFILMNAAVPWQLSAISHIKRIAYMMRSGAENELEILIEVCGLWKCVAQNAPVLSPDISFDKKTASKARLQLMMQFIHDSYASGITLEDIAGHACVSKSTALKLFREYLKTTPVDYLICYRLKHSAQLLQRTENKIGTIASDSGFSNVDYFCRVFKKHYHMTPTEYRRLH